MAESGVERSRRKPSETYDAHWIWQHAPEHFQGEILGKWLVFEGIQLIDQTWEAIRKRVASGELGAAGAKVSTMLGNTNARDNNKVICVYTTEEDMDAVGLKLIQLVKKTIRYKTDQATREGRYTSRGHGRVTCRTLEWNNGSPVFTA